MKKLILCLAVVCSSAYAADAPATAPTTTPTNAIAAGGNSDFFQPGWKGNYRHGIGYSASFIGSNTFVYDHYLNADNSLSAYFAYQNPDDSNTVTNGTTATTTTETFSGTKTIGTISFASSYNWRIYRNEWTNIRIGGLLGANIYTGVDYQTGTKSTVNATGVTTYTSYGTAKQSKSPQFLVGPVIMTAFNLRWFPMISAGMDGGIIFKTSSKTKTETSLQSGATSGTVTTTTSNSESESGFGGSTTGAGTFGFSTSFSIRYVW